MNARRIVSSLAALALAAILANAGPAAAQLLGGDPCFVADNGSGTVTLPPPGCSYMTPATVHMILDGLPPGTTIELAPIHASFFCRKPAGNGPCLVEPGGTLGGEREVFDSILTFRMTGTGELDGFTRVVSLTAQAETHTGPRSPSSPVQNFPTDMFQLQGALFGDPDFAQLQVTAGTNLGLPSPGGTTLTRLGPENPNLFHVDSFFDVAYQIDFVGAPGGALAGLSGSTQGTAQKMRAFGQRDPCLAEDDGTGTVELPPPGCDYLSPDEVHRIIDGLPPGTEIELAPRHAAFLCTQPGGCGQPGGGLGGEVEQFDSTLVLQLSGTGTLADFRRTLRVPVAVETHTGPRNPGDPVQSFDTEMVSLQGQLFGDPDFTQLTMTGGSANGLPSPGHTTLENRGDGTWTVDSFFDVAYRIDFVGAPGGALDGLSGSTTAELLMRARGGKTESVEPDDGTGTVTVPPEGGEYVSPDEVHMIIDGLPAGTTIELAPSHHSFFCDNVPCGQLTAPPFGDGEASLVAASGEAAGTARPGGQAGQPLTGSTLFEEFSSTLDIELDGTGALAGFRRTLTIPTTVLTSTGPRDPTLPVQSFDTEMINLQGSLSGDPDFQQLDVVAGSANGLPSPGHTTLTDLGDGNFVVDSFFDVEYQIVYVGAPGGALDGTSGTTTGTVRVAACERAGAPAHNVTIIKESDPEDGTDFSFTGLAAFSLDDDTDGTLPQRRSFFNLSPGIHAVTETVPAGWQLLSIVCDDPDGGTTVDLAAAEVMIDLDLGEAITCTFRNADEASLIFIDGFESGDTSRWTFATP
jgi:hypothetical protein